MSETKAKKPWVAHRPEQRFSVVIEQFLRDALLDPCYFTSIHDADEGARTNNQRARDRARGQKPGQLDWDIVQGQSDIDVQGIPLFKPLWRKLELKRGKNGLSENQHVTIAKLALCGARPVVAWSIREAHHGLLCAGFQFRANVETLLQKYEAMLDAMDRAAELTMAGEAPAKAPRKSKAVPRFTAGKGFVKRAKARGVRI